MRFLEENGIKKLLKEQPFYNESIEKPNIKHLSNVDMLSELPFHDELNIVKTAKSFKRYARSYSTEIIKDKDGNINDPLAQLEACKLVTKDLFRDLLIEMKGFKHQITRKVLLRKQKGNDDREFTTVYFNFTAKTVIVSKYSLDKSFREIFYRLDNWINKESA